MSELKSQAIMRYPRSAEKDIQILVGAYFAEIAKDARGLRLDAKDKHLEKLAFGAAVAGGLKKVADKVQAQTLKEWKRCVRSTLGIELQDKYYLGGLYTPEVNKWLLGVMQQLSELPGAVRSAVKKVMQQCAGQSWTMIRKAVNKKLSAMLRAAKSRAANAVAALFGVLNRKQQQDAGCDKYYWLSARDDRVRPCHRALDGHYFQWSNPPEMWVDTPHGRRYTGRRCNPGEDYGCRCIAIPVFDTDDYKRGVVHNG